MGDRLAGEFIRPVRERAGHFQRARKEQRRDKISRGPLLQPFVYENE
jgi:hypothetical protein